MRGGWEYRVTDLKAVQAVVLPSGQAQLVVPVAGGIGAPHDQTDNYPQQDYRQDCAWQYFYVNMDTNDPIKS